MKNFIKVFTLLTLLASGWSAGSTVFYSDVSDGSHQWQVNVHEMLNILINKKSPGLENCHAVDGCFTYGPLSGYTTIEQPEQFYFSPPRSAINQVRSYLSWDELGLPGASHFVYVLDVYKDPRQAVSRYLKELGDGVSYDKTLVNHGIIHRTAKYFDVSKPAETNLKIEAVLEQIQNKIKRATANQYAAVRFYVLFSLSDKDRTLNYKMVKAEHFIATNMPGDESWKDVNDSELIEDNAELVEEESEVELHNESEEVMFTEEPQPQRFNDGWIDEDGIIKDG